MSKALNVGIHPLVVLTIADHATRDRLQFNQDRVVGSLFGVQDGQDVHIMEAMGMKIKNTTGNGSGGSPNQKMTTELEWEKWEKELQIFKETYPGMEFLGWYSSGADIFPGDSAIHERMCELNERPLYVMLDTSTRDREGEEGVDPLGIHVYEHVISHEEEIASSSSSSSTSTSSRVGRSRVDFVKTKYGIVQDETERITVLHCAQTSSFDVGESGSVIAQSGEILLRSVTSLSSRVSMLLRYVEDVSTGKVPANYPLLRRIKSLTSRLPSMSTDAFEREFRREFNESLLQTYVATLAQATATLTDTVTMYNTKQHSTFK